MKYEDVPDHEKYRNVNPPPTIPKPKIKPPAQRPRGDGKTAKALKYRGENVVEALNTALENDPIAIRRLFKNRVVCNTDLADHRSVQVLELPCGRYTIGVIGFVNMVLVELGYPKVCSLHDEEDKLTGFDSFNPEKDKL